jgi:ribosomal protein L29
MSKIMTMSELEKMPEADLLREITNQYRTVNRLRLAVKSGKEKGSHLYKKEKDQLARMLTVLSLLRKKSPVSVPS